MEQWKEVESKGITWLVSDLGNVRTPPHASEYTRIRCGKSQTFTASFKGGPLSACVARTGYYEVAAKKQGKRVKELTHRLVGMAFVPGYRPELTINHINGVKTDNRPVNLEWVSLARNTQHAWEVGLVNIRGERHPTSKLTSKRVVYIRRLLAQGIPAHTLAIVAGVSQSTIALIRDGHRWPEVTHGKPVVVS